MKEWFQKLKVSHKLMLISIFFVIPDSVMLYLFITGVNGHIEFARMEKRGNEYQRPLEDLLRNLPEHRHLAERAREGEPLILEQLSRKQAQIEAAFDQLEEVDARVGADLQFTEEGLAKRNRQHYRVPIVRMEWRKLRTKLAKLPSEVSAAQHRHLIGDVRVMITHSGDLSNLILDPDLDSYYIMDATLLSLPQTQDRLAQAIDQGQEILARGSLTREDRRVLYTYARLLQEADLDRTIASVRASLVEDPNFYGASPTLQKRVPPLLEQYIARNEEFIQLAERVVTDEQASVTAQDFVNAGSLAREASFELWTVLCEELDLLLDKRIRAFQSKRAKSLIVAALAGLAACGFVTFITRSISGPLRKQAEELGRANDALQGEIVERKRAEAALRTAEERYRSLFENSVEGIFQTTADGRYLVANPTLARIYGYESVDELLGSVTDISRRLYVDLNRREEFKRLIAQAGEINSFDSEIYRKDGSVIWISEHARGVYDSDGNLLHYEGTVEDITERKRNEEQVERLNKQLIDTSRKAGMAEVATGVLHNVGNVLNSVNVSSLLIAERIGKSRVAHLTQVSATLQDHAADLGAFMTSDPKGQKIPGFIASLADRLNHEQQELLREAEALSKNISHIKDIVAVQQNYAKVSGVVEALPAAGLVEDALAMNGAAFARHRVEVVRQFDDVPLVRVDKHKVLQILINLVRNAKYAVSESSRRDKRMTVSISRNGSRRVKIAVSDNGIGIAKENLARIFAHGFTTKRDGHGFGLHSSALAARELGGSLVAHSDGPGHGAIFTLELPMEEPSSS